MHYLPKAMQYRQTHSAIFFTKLGMGGCPRSVASRQTSRLWLQKFGLTGVKIAKIANFWYNFAKKGYTSLTNFFSKFGMGRVSQVRTSRQIFAVLA